MYWTEPNLYALFIVFFMSSPKYTKKGVSKLIEHIL